MVCFAEAPGLGRGRTRSARAATAVVRRLTTASAAKRERRGARITTGTSGEGCATVRTAGGHSEARAHPAAREAPRVVLPVLESSHDRPRRQRRFHDSL